MIGRTMYFLIDLVEDETNLTGWAYYSVDEAVEAFFADPYLQREVKRAANTGMAFRPAVMSELQKPGIYATAAQIASNIERDIVAEILPFVMETGNRKGVNA
ncbi:MAG: hypothetical protein EOP84_12185 [Verrucomicrobiaceae bacterium]|nr:MAG: hypothetical protein EOP84_12185 [Verrucomicrobiaceae bacterium]